MKVSEKRIQVSDKPGMVFPFTPIGKPRLTRRDKWAKRPVVVAYYAYANAIRAMAASQQFRFPDSGAVFRFEFPMPDSWSKRKRREMLGQPHQQTPDIDNCIKAILDPLLEQDCTVWHIAGAEKRWAEEGSITLTISGAA